MIMKTVLTFSIFFFTSIFLNAQVIVSGFIKDKTNGESLLGANIVEALTQNGTVTDNNGYFSLRVKTPTTIIFSYIGYTSDSIQLTSKHDTLVQVLLNPGKELNEIVIKAERIARPNMVKLNMAEVQYVPSLSGKPDILKVLQLQPGIKTQGEGSSLMLVRGGGPGENLYLFDNVPVIYVNHLGGFMSVFNPDIINGMEIYKGGFPARYGGKLSSIVDITQKEGNTVERKGSVSVGLTDISFTLDGPINKKLTYYLTARKTVLFDLFTLGVTSLTNMNSFTMYYGFHDLNGKISWKPNAKNNIQLNVYQGDDYLKFREKPDTANPESRNKLTYKWGNWLVSSNWKHVISSRLFGSATLSFARYRLSIDQFVSFLLKNKTETLEAQYLSYVQDLSLQVSLKQNLAKNWSLEYGIKSSMMQHLPYTYFYQGKQKEGGQYIPNNESAAYVENSVTLPARIKLNAGLRLASFFTKDFNTYKWEPRISASKEIGKNHQLSMNYMRVNQFSHLLYTAGNAFSNEIWIPSDKVIKPAYSDQFSLSWNANLYDDKFSAEVTSYYKTLNDLATYKEGYLSLQGDEYWKTKIVSGGKGEAYGVEFTLKKNTGKLTGFAGYAWSRATRNFPGINFNQTYRYEYDRPHSITLSANYKFTEKISANATWIYQSGLPYTPVIGRQLTPALNPDQNGNYIYYETFIYGERNSASMKAYHRLDLGVTLNRFNEAKELKSSWSFSVYNAYNRQNAIYYYFNTTNHSEIINPEIAGIKYKPFQMYQISLFPIIPSFSYKYYFNQHSIKKKPLKKRLRNLLFYED